MVSCRPQLSSWCVTEVHMVTGGGSCARLFRNETSHDIWPIALHSAELSRMLQMHLGLFLFEIQWKLEPTACRTLICTLDLFLGLLQCSAEVWSHPSCLLPRSQTLLQFLKQFCVIDLNALFFGHSLLFHSFSNRPLYLTIFRGMHFLKFVLLSHFPLQFQA